ncbi:MAG TPA: ligase-associated DNA damage response DEXH box helicase [Leptolyngbyaceae cyanobacterium M33_DOE_097]|uniref:Ligase-associated DNA damage response DEXH box helicase n=1 Tax=Oscillatoriales cyanobacterium SpSt-418 TaxID=2282169 RepID=A0A7C3KGR8_9CYAN|nr:ligase-associated DNA damage response DEXH box helicase [Leptolyngbyaceae cyanobacterium M33_DOE_097]
MAVAGAIATLSPILAWFAQQHWEPLPFQQATWAAYLDGKSGMIQVPTGSGKTYAAVMGAIAEMLAKPRKGLQLLYITPLRALSRDIEQSIKRPITEMGWKLQVESRTGDTSSAKKARQLKNMPEILITTPESLALMLSYPGAKERFQSLQCVILDEWHELLNSKRGTQTELCLSHLRHLQPNLRTWAVSATLGNIDEAAQAAVGLTAQPAIIQSNLERKTIIRSILPASVDSFPWAGHLGLRMFEELVAALDINTSTLIFTNTRAQSERWFQALTFALPDDTDKIALHHSSIDVKEREAIEAGVKTGTIKWVVCTSSLDLGVDFQPVERVVQIGSAKNLARLLQRAGRSAHVPQGTSEILFLPTNALELLEIAAFRNGLAAGDLESRRSLTKPYDVLIQHLVNLACGDGFVAAETLASVRQTMAYQTLTEAEFGWVLDFITNGGKCLGAYPRYKKVTLTETGVYQVTDTQIARMHRMGVGTITSNQAVRLVYTNRKEIGTVEENFISKLKKGDVFFFAGRQLEFFMLKDMVAYVKGTTRKSTVTPTWGGGNLAISDTLSTHLRQEIAAIHTESDFPIEIDCLAPILAAQERIAHLPTDTELLIECCKTREGQHLYVFPFEGRFVHEGLGFLWGYRFANQKQATFTISVNDYGFEILAPKDYPFKQLFSQDFFSLEHLQADIKECVNISELMERKFRGIAQVSGLIFKGYPSSKKTSSQLQISSSLLYEVFTKYEPENLLLKQAENEVLREQLEVHRLEHTLERLSRLKIVWKESKRPSPFAFPLLVERWSSRMSNETLLDRIQRLKEQWQNK